MSFHLRYGLSKLVICKKNVIVLRYLRDRVEESIKNILKSSTMGTNQFRTTSENDYRIPSHKHIKSCRVSVVYFLLSDVFPFLTLTKVDWLKNGLKDHETEVPCCENLQAAILPSRLSAFFFILLFYRSNPPAIVHFIDFCEMDNINVNIKYPTYERDIGVNTYRRLRCF